MESVGSSCPTSSYVTTPVGSRINVTAYDVAFPSAAAIPSVQMLQAKQSGAHHPTSFMPLYTPPCAFQLARWGHADSLTHHKARITEGLHLYYYKRAGCDVSEENCVPLKTLKMLSSVQSLIFDTRHPLTNSWKRCRVASIPIFCIFRNNVWRC